MKTVIVAITAALTGGLVTTIPTGAVFADDPAPSTATVTVTIDCTHYATSFTGLHTGDSVMVTEGAEPPYGFTVGGNPWRFFVDEQAGTARGDVPIAAWESTRAFPASVMINGKVVWTTEVDCTPAAAPAPAVEPSPTTQPPIADEQITEVPAITAATPVEVLPWAGVALAPPW